MCFAQIYARFIKLDARARSQLAKLSEVNRLTNSNLQICLSQYSQLSVRLAAPNQLHPKPDAEDLVFGKHFTDHMLKVAYHKRLGGWQKPEIMPLENLVLHPAAKVFHYAVEVSSNRHPCSIFPRNCDASAADVTAVRRCYQHLEAETDDVVYRLYVQSNQMM